MGEHVLETVGELERVNVAESELDVHIHDELGETKDLSAQMDCSGQKKTMRESVSGRPVL